MIWVNGVLLGCLLVTGCRNDPGTWPLPPGSDPAVTWPNEPAGMTLVSDYGFESLTGPWRYRQEHADGFGRIVSDPQAPLSSGMAMEFVYPRGFTAAGHAPASMTPPAFDAAGEMYLGFHFKANAEWQSHESGINKIGYGWLRGMTTFGFVWHWGTGTLEGRQLTRVISFFEGPNVRYLHPNTAAAFVMEPGRWYRIEIYWRPSSASEVADGALRIWVDGRLATSYEGITTTPGPIDRVYFSPTWGGRGTIEKQHDDYFRIDHVRFSVR
jgi:hypothetical protein